MIADVLLQMPVEMQTLCIMQFLDHMEGIGEELGEALGVKVEIVHAETDAKKLLRCPSLRAISNKERKAIYERMESGDIRAILSTYVYKQGVNFPGLSVVINAGGGGSDIVAKQIPGRESRKIEGKEVSYLIDFWHPWDVQKSKSGKTISGPVHKDDKSRSKVYKELGFEQTWLNNVNELPMLNR